MPRNPPPPSHQGVRGRLGERIPAQPLVDWLHARIQRYAAENPIPGEARYKPDPCPRQRLAEELGISERRLWGYCHAKVEGPKQPDGSRSPSRPTDTFFRNRVEDMLHHAGVRLDEVYPDLAEDIELEPEEWCDGCGDFCTPIKGVCPWCERQVVDPWLEGVEQAADSPSVFPEANAKLGSSPAEHPSQDRRAA